MLDYEDLASVFTEAFECGEVTGVSLNHLPAKETADKEVLIDEVFAEIQKGPFDELRDKEITNAFGLAKSSDFTVIYILPMLSKAPQKGTATVLSWNIWGMTIGDVIKRGECDDWRRICKCLREIRICVEVDGAVLFRKERGIYRHEPC